MKTFVVETKIKDVNNRAAQSAIEEFLDCAKAIRIRLGVREVQLFNLQNIEDGHRDRPETAGCGAQIGTSDIVDKGFASALSLINKGCKLQMKRKESKQVQPIKFAMFKKQSTKFPEDQTKEKSNSSAVKITTIRSARKLLKGLSSHSANYTSTDYQPKQQSFCSVAQTKHSSSKYNEKSTDNIKQKTNKRVAPDTNFDDFETENQNLVKNPKSARSTKETVPKKQRDQSKTGKQTAIHAKRPNKVNRNSQKTTAIKAYKSNSG